MSELLDLYRTQAKVLWEWRGGRASLIKRGLLTFIVATFSFAVTAWLVPGIEIANIGAAALAVILIGLFFGERLAVQPQERQRVRKAVTDHQHGADGVQYVAYDECGCWSHKAPPMLCAKHMALRSPSASVNLEGFQTETLPKIDAEPIPLRQVASGKRGEQQPCRTPAPRHTAG